MLRAEVKSGSAEGKKIAKIIEEGKIVVSETTVGLLRKAMSQSDGPFLIDGFPRTVEQARGRGRAKGRVRARVRVGVRVRIRVSPTPGCSALSHVASRPISATEIDGRHA